MNLLRQLLDRSPELAQHGSVYLVARVVPGALNFVALAAYTRLLDPETFGRYALVLAGAAIAYVVLFQWLPFSVARFRQAFEGSTAAFMSAVLTGFVAAVIVSGAVVAVLTLGGVVPGDLLGFVAIGLGIVWAQAWYEINLELARSELDPMQYMWRSFTRSIGAVGLGVTLAAAGFGAMGVLAGYLAGYVLGSIRGWRRWLKTSLRPPGHVLRPLLTYGLPFVATFALNYVVNGSDRLLIGFLRATDEAGLYAAGYDLANGIMAVLVSVVNLAGYPLAVRAFEQVGADHARTVIERNTVALVGLALPAAAGLTVLAPQISSVFLGEAFHETAIQIVPWVAFGGFFLWMKAFYADLAFQLQRATGGQAAVSLLAAGTNIVLNLWWIPAFGLIGAAYATFASYLIGFVASLLLGRRLFPMPFPVGASVRIAAATGIMMLSVGALQIGGLTGLVVRALVGTMIYAGLVLALDVHGVRGWLVDVLRREAA